MVKMSSLQLLYEDIVWKSILSDQKAGSLQHLYLAYTGQSFVKMFSSGPSLELFSFQHRPVSYIEVASWSPELGQIHCTVEQVSIMSRPQFYPNTHPWMASNQPEMTYRESNSAKTNQKILVTSSDRKKNSFSLHSLHMLSINFDYYQLWVL